MQAGKARSGSARGRLYRGAIATMLAVVGVLSLAGGQALASKGFAFETSFGPATPLAVATDKAGNVYEYNPSTGKVSKRSPTGTLIDFSSGIAEIEGLGGAGAAEVEIAVDNSTGPDTGDIYVATGSGVHIYNAEGKPLGELTGANETCGVAVDSSGNVYMSVYPATVEKFVPSGDPVTNADLSAAITGGALDEICNIAVGPTGSVYAANYEGRGVTKFEASEFGISEPPGTQISTSGPTLATDSSGDVYIDETNQIAVYGPTGEVVANVTGGPTGEPFEGSIGVAWSPSGQLFVDDGAHTRVDVFEPIALPTTEPPVIEAEAATLEGSISPEGAPTTYQFEYGTSTSYGSFAPATPASAGSGTGVVPVSMQVGGLLPDTVYHYRLVSTGGHGVLFGFDQTFTTLGPLATIGAASSNSSSSATLTGFADARGIPGATYRFLVTSSTSPYSGATVEAAVPAGTGSVPVSATIGELPANGTYSVRLVVAGGGATSYSETTGFQTPSNSPYVVAPAPPISSNPYGCTTPVLNAYAAHPKAGQTVTITGSDLGVGGELTVGSEHPATSSYTSTSFVVTLPATASGKVPVTLNCGHASNTIDLTITPPPSNAVSVKQHSVKGATGTLKVAVAGKGSLAASGADIRSAKSKPSKKSTVTLKVTLGPAGKKALAKSHRLAVTVTVTFTPTGGTAKSTKVTLTFKG